MLLLSLEFPNSSASEESHELKPQPNFFKLGICCPSFYCCAASCTLVLIKEKMVSEDPDVVFSGFVTIDLAASYNF